MSDLMCSELFFYTSMNIIFVVGLSCCHGLWDSHCMY